MKELVRLHDRVHRRARAFHLVVFAGLAVAFFAVAIRLARALCSVVRVFFLRVVGLFAFTAFVRFLLILIL